MNPPVSLWFHFSHQQLTQPPYPVGPVVILSLGSRDKMEAPSPNTKSMERDKLFPPSEVSRT